MRLGKQDIALLRFAVPGRPYPRDSRSDDLWFQHLAIVVNDIDAAHAHLHLRSIVLKLPDPMVAWPTPKHFGGIGRVGFTGPVNGRSRYSGLSSP